jgi:transposase-like protein
MDRDELLRAVTEANWNVAAAARAIGVHETTLRYRLQALGIERPARPALPIERHPPVARLTAELEALRAQARVVARTYLPGPQRAAFLRDLEVNQRRVQARLRQILGEQPITGGTRARETYGSVRPAWECWRS